jgi:hypothetical protein
VSRKKAQESCGARVRSNSTAARARSRRSAVHGMLPGFVRTVALRIRREYSRLAWVHSDSAAVWVGSCARIGVARLAAHARFVRMPRGLASFGGAAQRNVPAPGADRTPKDRDNILPHGRFALLFMGRAGTGPHEDFSVAYDGNLFNRTRACGAARDRAARVAQSETGRELIAELLPSKSTTRPAVTIWLKATGALQPCGEPI